MLCFISRADDKIIAALVKAGGYDWQAFGSEDGTSGLLPKEKGACFYFMDHGSRAMYSYVRVGADDIVKEVREKNAIST